MFRSTLCIAASVVLLLFVSVSIADEGDKDAKAEKKPVAKEGSDKKESPEGYKKDNPKEMKKGVKEGVKKEGMKPAPGGKVTKVGLEGETLRVTIEGKDYDFAITDKTAAFLKTKTQDGKEVVVALQLFNASDPGKKVIVKNASEKKPSSDKNEKGEQKKSKEGSDQKRSDEKSD